MQILRLHLLNHPCKVVLVHPEGPLEFLAAYRRGYRKHRTLVSERLWMKKLFLKKIYYECSILESPQKG
jgi:hypothetical protein